MTINLPCNIGDTIHIKTDKAAYVAKCVGFKVMADSKGVTGRVILSGVFGVRNYNLDHFGRTLFTKSDCE